MRLVVAALGPSCPAELALFSENLDPEVHILRGETEYAELLARLWREGQGFILVEHDVVPWPGALRELEACPESWCAFPYPSRDHAELTVSLGCAKFSRAALEATRDLERTWEHCPWHSLDGNVIGPLRHALGSHDLPHLHSPPVAHVRRH